MVKLGNQAGATKMVETQGLGLRMICFELEVRFELKPQIHSLNIQTSNIWITTRKTNSKSPVKIDGAGRQFAFPCVKWSLFRVTFLRFTEVSSY